MPSNPIDQRIAADNAALRAHDRRATQAEPQRPPLPDRATIGERLHAHGQDPGAEVRKRMADDLHAVTASVDKLRRNPTLNAAQVELAVAEAVRGRVERLRAECEDESKRIDAAEREVEQAIDDAFTPSRPEWHGLATEFRAVLSDMDPDKRFDFIKRMDGTRHAALLRFAIASVPPELSGAPLSLHKQMVDTTIAIKDPTLLTRPKELRTQRAALARAVEGIERTAAELADFDKADAIKELTK